VILPNEDGQTIYQLMSLNRVNTEISRFHV
jgi:hypothetical protein